MKWKDMIKVPDSEYERKMRMREKGTGEWREKRPERSMSAGPAVVREKYWKKYTYKKTSHFTIINGYSQWESA